jgi:hypothetical protein
MIWRVGGPRQPTQKFRDVESVANRSRARHGGWPRLEFWRATEMITADKINRDTVRLDQALLGFRLKKLAQLIPIGSLLMHLRQRRRRFSVNSTIGSSQIGSAGSFTYLCIAPSRDPTP